MTRPVLAPSFLKILGIGAAFGLFGPVEAQTVPAEQASSSATVIVSPQPLELASASGQLKKLSLEQLMDLDVTSVSKQPQPYGEAPAAIEVITNDAIRRSGATDIPEALRLADNLEVAQKTSHDWAISSRGFNTDSANKLLVLMDGRSVYTPLFSGVFWDVQDYLLEDIDRIEVISGPGGTLWGANAVNGVINVTSKSAKDTQGTYLEGGIGTELRGLGGVRYGGTLAEDIYYRVYGKYTDRDHEAYPDGSDASDSWRMARGGFRMDAGSKEEGFTLQGDYYGGDTDLSSGRDAVVDGGNLLGRWTRSFPDDSSLSLQVYYDRTYLDLPVPASVTSGGATLAPAGELYDYLDTYDMDFQHRFHLDSNNNVIWGMGYRFTHDVTDNSPGLAFDPGALDQTLYSGFIQDELGLWKDLTLTFGSKIEHNDYTAYEFEPSARIKWDLAQEQMVWAAVSRAVRTPSRIDRSEQLPTPNFSPLVDYLLVGDGTFESEVVVSYELGYRAKWGSQVFTSLTLFFNNYDDIRSTIPSATGFFGLPLSYANGILAQTGGIEWTIDFQPMEGWRLHAGYDLLQENLWAEGQADFNNNLNETADPKNQVFLRSSIDLPGELELDPAFRWVDSLVYNMSGVPGTLPSYAELDIRLGWKPVPEIELSVTGQNLLTDHHSEYVISSPNPREDIQRAVYGKIACRF